MAFFAVHLLRARAASIGRICRICKGCRQLPKNFRPPTRSHRNEGETGVAPVDGRILRTAPYRFL